MQGVSCKFSDEELNEIQRLWEDEGMPQVKIAKKFNTSRQYISLLLRYRSSKRGVPGRKKLSKEELLNLFHTSYIVMPYGCWEWDRITSNGYGVIKRIHAHRFSYENLIGPIGDKDVLHKCNNSLCVNPNHLYLGTDVENGWDRIVPKFSIDEMRLMEELILLSDSTGKKKHPTKSYIARIFNVCPLYIHRIRRLRQYPCTDGVYTFNCK